MNTSVDRETKIPDVLDIPESLPVDELETSRSKVIDTAYVFLSILAFFARCIARGWTLCYFQRLFIALRTTIFFFRRFPRFPPIVTQNLIESEKSEFN